MKKCDCEKKTGHEFEKMKCELERFELCDIATMLEERAFLCEKHNPHDSIILKAASLEIKRLRKIAFYYYKCMRDEG